MIQRPIAWSVVLLAAACGGNDPSGPSTGSLAVTVLGLPASAAGAVTVTGPEGYQHHLSASETLAGLPAGEYTVAADPVTSAGQAYQPAPATQTVTISTTATASVLYALAGGNLTLNVAGLPPGVSAAVHVTGPDNYRAEVTASTTLVNLYAGVYTVTAETVSPGGAGYNPSPATQTVNLPAAGESAANVSYTPASMAGFDLRIDGMYLTQSVQTYADDVPLVKDRDGYLRVFVTANQSNVAAPQVRVRLYQNGQLVTTLTIAPPGPSVPLWPDEGSVNASWNVPVPGSLIQPGLSILADVDPDNLVPEGDETNNAFPASGTPVVMDVHTTSAFSVHFVPVVQAANGRRGSVSDANKDSFLTAAMRIHPLAGYEADVGSPYTTMAPVLQGDNANGAWSTILSQIEALRVAEGSSRHYYGVVSPPYTSGVAGIGYIGGLTAIGWDRSGVDMVAAHEWGHNWGRKHAPCGGPSNPDASYPYANGTIGVYGFDVAARSIKPPSWNDLMGYCSNEWISDYTYRGVLAYREAHPDAAADVAAPGFAQATQPCLLVWGRIERGQTVLEPAFQIITRPSLPVRGGPYVVEGRDRRGGQVFRVSFQPQEVADDPAGAQHFAFAVPLQADRAASLDLLRVTAPGRATVSVRAAVAGAPVEVRAATEPGGVALRWDAVAHPMVMVRDPVSGHILSFARGGEVYLRTDRRALDVQLSNGVAGQAVRVRVPGR
ncbi:MAG: CARDB domain-containing protein [Gemmatimonadales bacterium]